MGVKWYLVVFICIFLVTNNVEHLFMCLLAICIYSSGKCLFSCSFVTAELLEFPICSGYQSLLSIWFTNIFSHSVGCFFTLLTVSILWYKEVFNLMKSTICTFYFCCLCFWCQIPETTAKSSVMKIIPHVFSFILLALKFRFVQV